MRVEYIYSRFCGSLEGFDSNVLESTIKKILKYFPELKDIHSILYFDHYFCFRNIAATLYPLKYPSSGLSIEHPDLVPICRQFPNLDFLVYCYDYITNGDILDRVFNLSHEFQHASQYTYSKKVYLYGCIIRFIQNDIGVEVWSPIEYDAIRKSKIVAYDICGDDAVERLIKQMLSNPDVPKEFWKVFKSINVNEEYNLENTIFGIWETHKIEEKIQELISTNNIGSDEKKVIEMYNFANSN